MPFFDALDRMVDELRKHPEVELLSYECGETADRERVRGVISKFVTPTESMLDFYSTRNGVFLEWGLKCQDYEPIEPFGAPEYNTAPGCINLLPFEDVFSTRWQPDAKTNFPEPDFWRLVYGRDPDPEQETTVVVVDHFSNYYHTALLLGPDPFLIVATDHGADLECSDYLTFSAYLDLVVSCYGTNPYDVLGFGWLRTTQRFDTIPSFVLDDLVQELEEQTH